MESKWKSAKFPLGVLLVLVVVFSLFEWVAPSSTPETVAMIEEREPVKIRPKVYLKNDGSVQVDMGFLENTRVRYSTEDNLEQGKVLFACMKSGIEETYGPDEAPIHPFENSDRRVQRKQMRAVVRQVVDRCLREEPEGQLESQAELRTSERP